MENDNDDVDDKTDFKQNLTGYIYQLKLLLLFLWRGLKSGSCNKFQLGTELKEAEKFDDAIFFYEKAAKTYVRYMQAKYSRFDKNVLKFKDFVSEWNGARCNLKKYFISYRKIKQRPYQKELDDLIICTNIPFGQLTLTQNATDILTFRDVTGKTHDKIFKGMKKYQLEAVNSSPKLLEKIKYCTNLNLLAKELVICIFKDNNILNLQDYWISAYFNALIEENVIEQREEYYKLSMEDSKNNGKTNIDIRNFRQHFVEKRMRIDGITNDNVMFKKNFIDKLKLQKGSVQATLEETAEILVEHATKNLLSVPPNFTNMIFDKLVDLVECQQSFFFTDKFSCDMNLSANAKAFRDLLMKECETEVAKHLPDQQIFVANALNGIKMYATKAKFQNIDEEKMAKDMIQHIFYKKELTNIFKPEYSFLKDVFKLTGMNTLQFTKDFAKNNNGNFRKLFLKLYAEEKVKNTTIKFKQNIEKYSAIIDQLKKAYKNAKIKKTTVLKFDQTNWKKNKVEGLLEALNGSIFEATNERDKIKFRDIFTNIHQRIPNKIAEKFKSDLNFKFKKDFQKLKYYKIEYINYPPHFDQLTEESTPIMDDIEKFREKMFIVNTPTETELMADISNEMRDRFNLLDGDTMTYNLFQEVLGWAKEKEDRFLSQADITTYFNNIEANISEKFEVGCSLQYMCKLEEYSITYNEHMDELISFLGLPPFAPNPDKILHIQTNEKLLMAIKVCQTINSFPYFKKKDYFIFNPLTRLRQMEKCDKHVSKAFDSTVDLIIIVEKEVLNGLQQFCNVLCNIIIQKQNKKIVIISNKDSQLLSFLIILKTQKLIQTITQKIVFDNLTRKSQNMIMQNTTINFQGNDILLHQFMNDKEASQFVDSETLQDIINGKRIIIGKPLEIFTNIESERYRPRQLRLMEVDTLMFFEKRLPEKNLFAIEGMEYQEFSNTKKNLKLPLPNSFVLNVDTDKTTAFIKLEKFEAEKQFQDICNKNPECCVHWLKKSGEKLIWCHSYVPSTMSLKEFGRYIKRETEYIFESFFEDHIRSNQAIIVADNAGMGKSTLLTSFSNLLKNEKRWKIRINLNQYVTVLNEIQKKLPRNINELHLNFDNCDLKENDYGKFILQSLIASTSCTDEKLTFEKRVFNHSFTNRGILYIFDGFDEINPNYGETILTLLKLIQENQKNRIWIASRKNFQKELEKTLNTFSYDLKPFDEKDQEIFLKQYWLSNYKREKGIDMPNQKRLSFYVKKLIHEASKTIGDIIGIPLQTKMFAEIFQENHDDGNSWLSCFEYVEAEIVPKLLHFSSKLNILTIYEKFFLEKICKYFLFEKSGVEPSNPNTKDLEQYTIAAEYPIYKIFGCLTLTTKNEQDILLTNEERQFIEKWYKEFNNGNKKVGIIDDFDGEVKKPLFNHFTYAEYFAACYFIEKLCVSPSYFEQILKITEAVFPYDVPVFKDCFIYKIKKEIDDGRINGEDILKFISKRGFLNCVYVFIRSEVFNSAFSDATVSWCNALHYAAENENLRVVMYITIYIYDITYRFERFPFIQFLYDVIFDNDNIKTFKYVPHIKRFFDDIKTAAVEQVTFTKHQNFQSRFKDGNSYEVNKNSEIYKMDRLMNILSLSSIINISEAYESHFFFKTDNFVNNTCLRYDLKNEEKIKIFENVVNDVNNDHTDNILRATIQNDCIELLDGLLTNKKFNFTNKDLYDCFEIACRMDLLPFVKKLLPLIKENNDIDLYSKRTYSALFCKAKLEIIEFVFEATEVNEDVVITAIECQCNIKTISYLIEKGVHENKIENNSKSKFLEKKIYENNGRRLDMVDCFEEEFKNQKTNDLISYNKMKTKDECGNTLLHNTVNCKTVKHITSLLQEGYCYNAKNNKGETPVILAKQNPTVEKLLKEIDTYFINAEKNDFNFLKTEKKYIKKKKIYLNDIIQENGKSLLHYAIENSNLDAMKNLLRYHCNFNKVYHDGKTLLYHAVANNNVEMVKLILKKARKKRRLNYPTFDIYFYNYGNEKTLFQNECTILLSYIKNCLNHVHNKDTDQLKYELDQIAEEYTFYLVVNTGIKGKKSVVKYATKNYEIAIYLIQKGIQIEAFELNVNSISKPLNFKIQKMLLLWVEIAQFVSTSEIYPDSVIKYFENRFAEILHFFSINKETADKIVANIRFNFGNYSGSTLLHITAIANREKIAHWLVTEKNADPYAKDYHGNTVFDLAEKHNSVKVLSELLPKKIKTTYF